jgi:hypothetical protein
MEAAQFMRTDVATQARTFDVYRTSGRSYDSSDTQDGTVDVALSTASASGQVVTEGTDSNASFVGHAVPQYDGNGDPAVRVGDELRLQSDTAKRYEVTDVVGLPDDVDPTLWELGLDRSNDSS